MKKIYILTAVFALLTLSLNAQLKANKKGVVMPPTTIDKVVTPPDGYFRMGPSRVSTDPVTPPYSNGFDSSTEQDWWEVINANNDTKTWTFSSGLAVYSYHGSNPADDWLITAPLVLKAGKVYSFSIKAYIRGTSYPEKLEVMLASDKTVDALSAGTTIIPETTITTTSSSNTLSNENVTVSADGTYYIGIHATSNADMWELYVDDFVIDVEADPIHDLSIALSAPATAGAGSTVTLTATVTNTGNYDENGYTVTFTANGTTIDTQTGGALAQGASATFTTTYTTDANAGTVSFGASVACTDDAEASNDNATASTEVFVLAPPENVNATGGEHNGTMTWTAPTIESTVGTVVENFDDTNVFPSFSIGGITATQHTGTIGGWTVYDPSGLTVYGFQSISFENSGDPQAWTVFNPSSAGSAQTTHSGAQMMTSFCVDETVNGSIPATDHWLISPELSGNAQTITFWNREINQSYGAETYEVWISSTDNDPASFTKLDDLSASDQTNWVQQTVSLPAGTKYFALRHTATDVFGLLIDDVTYEGIISGPQPISYNIYLDGQLVDNVDANTFTYTFNNVEGEHECAVSAVYALGESEAVPAEFTTIEKTDMPTISVVTNADGSKTITATGDGTVHLYIDGVEVENPYTITPSIDGDITVTVTATAQEEGKLISDTATETVTVPEAGRSPKPDITFTDNGDGTYTITVTGTGEVAVYIDDAEHAGTPIATADGSFSFNVEQHSQAMTITVSATNQEEGLAISRTVTETFSIPAMTIDSEFQELDPQPSNASTPIDMSNLMFCDRFSVVIPNENNHPRLYDYYLQETQVRQRTSNSVEVPVKHTGSDGLGFYTLDQIDNDVNVGIDHDKGLKMNVRNAAMDLPLEADPNVYYYTESRGTKAYPDQAGRKYLAVLQRTSDGFYNENLTSAYDYGVDPYPGGQHHIHLDTDTITGDYNNYLAYVPIVWTMGFNRVNYETDHIHNSYGAPKWKTGVAKVEVISVNAERQTGVQGSTNWMEGSIPCSMYMIDEITAIGTMPSVNTMPYKPYMFRVFVESKNGKLRGYKKIGDGATINDATHYEGDGNGPQTGPFCIWSEYVDGSTCIGENGYEYTFSRGKISEVDSLGHWIVPDYKNIMFAAEDNLLTETNQYGQEVIQKNELNIFVRFYYIVEGADEGHTIPASGPYTGQRNRDGEAPGGYGSESPGTSPSPSTAVNEISLGSGVIVSQTFYNAQGMTSDKPFDGINIVITRYSDGTTRTTKVVR